MTEKIPVAVIDDHPVVRDGLAYLLGEQPDFVVVGEAGDPATALEVIATTSPRVVVLDLSLQGQEAIPLLNSLHLRWPQLRILVLSMHDEDLYAERMLALGAHGYVMKQEAPGEFLRALRRVAAGQTYVSKSIAARALARPGRRVEGSSAGPAQLTHREQDLLRLVARGLGTREIAAELGISVKTVDSHRRNIRDKLGLANVRDVVRYAVRWADEAGPQDEPG